MLDATVEKTMEGEETVASDSVVIKAINDEPGLRKEWRNLSETQKRRVLESAKGCTDGACLRRAMDGPEADIYQEYLDGKIKRFKESGFVVDDSALNSH
jgi:hypothetical protein